jgi:hypothetical protein
MQMNFVEQNGAVFRAIFVSGRQHIAEPRGCKKACSRRPRGLKRIGSLSRS